MASRPNKKEWDYDSAERKNEEYAALHDQIQLLEDRQRALEPGDPEQLRLEQEIAALRKKFKRMTNQSFGC